MDILIAIFLFIIAFVISSIGVSRRNVSTAQGTFFAVMGGMLFFLMAIMIQTDPIATVSRTVTVENVSVANITNINMTFTMQQIPNNFNGLIVMLMVGIGAFLVLIGITTFPR